MTENRGTAAALAIDVEGLQKRYGSHHALRGVNLAVPQGAVLGLLGPNGAGKTTTTRILATLSTPDGGRARVAGYDVVRQPNEVRRRIGVTGQYTSLDEVLTGRENLLLIGRLLRRGRVEAARRATELLEQMDLVDAADRPAGTYSGGMRRRLDLASCLIGRPPVLFLDEPTTGLDPTSRLVLWNMVREQVRLGVTVLLTTQYLEEAEQLADRIVVIDDGRVIAEGSTDELKRKVGNERIQFTVTKAEHVSVAMSAVALYTDGLPDVDLAKRSLSVPVKASTETIALLSAALHYAGVEVQEFAVRRPSLNDVFFELTGHHVSAAVTS